jgi:hypothetical protein
VGRSNAKCTILMDCPPNQENEHEYTRLIRKDDVEGVLELLTNREVERRVLQVSAILWLSCLPEN